MTGMGEGIHKGIGARVVGLSQFAQSRDERRAEHHEIQRAFRAHLGQDLRAPHLDVEHGGGVFRGIGDHHALAADAGGVDDAVEGAELRDGLFDDFAHPGFVRHVGL